jgi:prolyl-tRNA synthetase
MSMLDKEKTLGLTAKKSENFSEWYNQVVLKAGLADYAPIGGCMVIKPYGYAIWERIQAYFDRKIKATGHKNAYFPLFIPERFLHKEAEHFKGFVPEVAWVEEANERFAIRPTSETIMYDSYAKWIRSWRDLPLLLNQWCNIVRWETKVCRLFLRTREFLWQEGHTAHATHEEADKEALQILSTYKDVMENLLSIPVLTGKKTESEKFAGALYTTTLEALMPDGRALQMGTSHNLGQNFSKPFNIKFLDKDEKEKYVWQTSWGISTRLIGAVVMVHGDDKGLILPPRVAPVQVVIVPILFEKTKEVVLNKAKDIRNELRKYRVELDDREHTPGWKFNEWELKGVPIRIEIGPKDVEKNQVVLVRRDNREKQAIKIKDVDKKIKKTLEDIQNNLFSRAKQFLRANTKEAMDFDGFKKLVKARKMIRANWCGLDTCEARIKEETGATIRCIPLKKEKIFGPCVYCCKKATAVVYFARAY